MLNIEHVKNSHYLEPHLICVINLYLHAIDNQYYEFFLMNCYFIIAFSIFVEVLTLLFQLFESLYAISCYIGNHYGGS